MDMFRMEQIIRHNGSLKWLRVHVDQRTGGGGETPQNTISHSWEELRGRGQVLRGNGERGCSALNKEESRDSLRRDVLDV